MEAITANRVLLIVFDRKAIQESLLRHRLMEGRVEHTYLRYAGHQLLAGIDTDQVSRVVKRRKLIAFLDLLQNLIRQKRGSGKLFSAMNDTMANSADFT